MASRTGMNTIAGNWRTLASLSSNPKGPTINEETCGKNSTNFFMAGEQGFEPQLPGSEPGVLPLDDSPN